MAEGHPDKIADLVSDAVLDAVLSQDPQGRVACETFVKTGMVLVGGEITTSAWVDIDQVVRDRAQRIGYNNPALGFDWESCAVLTSIGKQSPDIAMGVDQTSNHEQGAGDQGIMFGYATSETDVLMPAPIVLAHKLMRRQSELLKTKELPWLRPDGKSQVTLRYENDLPVGIESWSSSPFSTIPISGTPI